MTIEKQNKDKLSVDSLANSIQKKTEGLSNDFFF